MTRDEAWIAAAKICQDVAELDRDSCEHMTPDDMLVTWDELQPMIAAAILEAVAAERERIADRQPREITDAMVEAFLDSWYGSRAWDKHYPPDHSAHAFTEETVLDRRRGCRAALEAAERARTEK